MTNFVDFPQIEELSQFRNYDMVEDLLDSDYVWDLDMDDQSNSFETYSDSHDL